MIELLACPVTGSPLTSLDDGLESAEGRRYPVRFGVPVLVPGARV
jgi:uncharacterized protein YbaR (Trm112 family)